MSRKLTAMRVAWLGVAYLSIVGCSSGGTKPSPSTGKVKDVPMQARPMLAEPRKRILVLPFLDASAARSVKVAEEARKTLIRNLAKSDKFVIVHPSDLTKDPGTAVVNGEYDMDSMIKAGEALGLSAIIEGKILDIKAKRLGDDVGLFRRFRAKMDGQIRIRMYSVRGNREILNQVRTASVEGTTTKFMENSNSSTFLEEDAALISEVVTKAFQTTTPMIIQAVEKLSWEGRIAYIQGNRIFLNAGRLSGLQVGDVLKVTGPGEEIFDPESGDLIGLAPGRMKGTLELVSYFGQDGAVSVIHSGSGFKENDIVELY